ncbi:MAG: R2-like ligand-binding oxidase [Balneolaceae bacterium]
MWFRKEKEESSQTKSWFSSTWMSEWQTAINSSTSYQKAGKKWNAPIVLKIVPPPDEFEDEKAIGFFLDLQEGSCEELRYAKQEDEDRSDVVLSGDAYTWKNLITKKKDPLMLLMKGGIKLEKGSLFLLSTQKKAATELLKCAPDYSHGKAGASTAAHTAKHTNGEFKRTYYKTVRKGLDHESFPMQLFQKSKRLGIWNPSDIDLEKDRADWELLEPKQKEIILHLTGLFMAGEEAVTLDLLPLIRVIAKEGRIEEEIYLTSFLWEEAKHTEFFSRYVTDVFGRGHDFERFHKPFYRTVFYTKLPQALHRLEEDASPLAQLKAAGTYNMIVEGTLAETGYEAYYKMLNDNDLMPGMQKGITLLKQDESRHIAFGIYLINRLLQDNIDLKPAFEEHLEDLLNDATNMIHEIFEPYDEVPFGLDKDWFLEFAIKQFQHRIAKLDM